MDVVKKKHWWQSSQLAWSVNGLLCLLVGYLVILMYVQGEYLFAIMTLVLSSVGLYIFSNRKAYVWRYVYPGLAGMGLFVLFPLICTIAIAFTNYSSTNQLAFERAQQVLIDRSLQAGKSYNFALYPVGSEWKLALTDAESGKSRAAVCRRHDPAASSPPVIRARSVPAPSRGGSARTAAAGRRRLGGPRRAARCRCGMPRRYP